MNWWELQVQIDRWLHTRETILNVLFLFPVFKSFFFFFIVNKTAALGWCNLFFLNTNFALAVNFNSCPFLNFTITIPFSRLSPSTLSSWVCWEFWFAWFCWLLFVLTGITSWLVVIRSEDVTSTVLSSVQDTFKLYSTLQCWQYKLQVHSLIDFWNRNKKQTTWYKYLLLYSRISCDNHDFWGVLILIYVR